jgi:hypothetical protein
VRKDRLNNSTGQGFFNIRLRQTKSEPTTEDLYGPTTEVPVEDSPQTVSRALRGQIGGNGEPLCQTDLVRLLNLSCDDPATYQAELARLSPAELDYLYRELPELRPREVSGGA